MNNMQQQVMADIIQSEINSSAPMIKMRIPDDLLVELFEWKQDKDNNISIEALKRLENILKNYF